MTNGHPSRVDDVEAHWVSPPPELSARCEWWLRRISSGWRPNSRIRTMGYYERAEFYGVYIWESINVIGEALRAAE